MTGHAQRIQTAGSIIAPGSSVFTKISSINKPVLTDMVALCFRIQSPCSSWRTHSSGCMDRLVNTFSRIDALFDVVSLFVMMCRCGSACHGSQLFSLLLVGFCLFVQTHARFSLKALHRICALTACGVERECTGPSDFLLDSLSERCQSLDVRASVMHQCITIAGRNVVAMVTSK